MALKISLLSNNAERMIDLFSKKNHHIVSGYDKDAELYWITEEYVSFNRGTNVQDISQLKFLLKEFPVGCKKPIFIECKTLPKTLSHLIKFLKLSLHSVDLHTAHKKIINVGVEHNQNRESITKLCHQMFNYEIDPEIMLNREVEYIRLERDVIKAVLSNLESTLRRYKSKINIPIEPLNDKPGFDAVIAESLASLTSELKRLGQQTGMLQAVQLENIIYRSYQNDDLPSLEVSMPEKTTEKLALKSAPDNKA